MAQCNHDAYDELVRDYPSEAAAISKIIQSCTSRLGTRKKAATPRRLKQLYDEIIDGICQHWPDCRSKVRKE